MEDLKYYHLKGVPNSLFYIPNFISEDRENYLLSKIYQSPKPKWTCLSNRRLQNWGGLPHSKGMIPEKLPNWLQDCCDLVSQTEVFGKHKPNHVLVNEYKPGQGIMPHKDGPLYYPIVTTISLGCYTILDFYEEAQREDRSHIYQFSVLLERRSLFVVRDSVYTDHLHGISESKIDHLGAKVLKNVDNLGDDTLKNKLMGSPFLTRDSARVSLTIRHVPKTINFTFKT